MRPGSQAWPGARRQEPRTLEVCPAKGSYAPRTSPLRPSLGRKPAPCHLAGVLRSHPLPPPAPGVAAGPLTSSTRPRLPLALQALLQFLQAPLQLLTFLDLQFHARSSEVDVEDLGDNGPVGPIDAPLEHVVRQGSEAFFDSRYLWRSRACLVTLGRVAPPLLREVWMVTVAVVLTGESGGSTPSPFSASPSPRPPRRSATRAQGSA